VALTMRIRYILVSGVFACAGAIHPAWSADFPQPKTALREAITLTLEEHETVLGKMRDLLALSQLILDGAVNANMKQVAMAAREGGLHGGAHMPPSVQAKLPLPFRQLAQATHRTFDEIVQEAEQTGNRDAILRKLSENLQRCVTCHANYTVRSAPRSQ